MINNILFDFDGVILDSMPTREYGFRKIFEEYDSKYVDKLIDFHNKNGGLSRFVKIKYFYNHCLQEEISEADIHFLANKFSDIMKGKLANKKYLIKDTLDFIAKNNSVKHIVSGSEEKELSFLCKELGISKYFKTIEGSPTPKVDLVKNIIYQFNYKLNETILIGDSINDYEAATINGISFYGFNNNELESVSEQYITNFELFKESIDD